MIAALASATRAAPSGAALDAAYADAMAAAHAQFPDDQDIAVLFADAVMKTSPWDYWEADGRTRRAGSARRSPRSRACWRLTPIIRARSTSTST